MKKTGTLVGLLVVASAAFGETNQERGKRVIDQAVARLAVKKFLNMKDRVESAGVLFLPRTTIRTIVRQDLHAILDRPEPPIPAYLGVRERQSFGKKKKYRGPVH